MSKAIIRGLEKEEYVQSISKEIMTGGIDYETTDDFEYAELVNTETTDLRKIETLLNFKPGRLEFDTDLVKFYQLKTQDAFLQKARDIVDSYASKLENYDDNEAIVELIATVIDEINNEYTVALDWEEIEPIIRQGLDD